MLINGKNHKTLEFKHINSLISFEEWLKENLSVYPGDSSVPKEHIIAYLGYVKQAVYDQKVEDKREWLDQLDGLAKRAEK